MLLFTLTKSLSLNLEKVAVIFYVSWAKTEKTDKTTKHQSVIYVYLQ
uniref:Uncharacterized protein n=1 Tax=Anguilla anguilla TaxID=7936 RepID=A0A0E9V130_ANGAN